MDVTAERQATVADTHTPILYRASQPHILLLLLLFLPHSCFCGDFSTSRSSWTLLHPTTHPSLLV